VRILRTLPFVFANASLAWSDATFSWDMAIRPFIADCWSVGEGKVLARGKSGKTRCQNRDLIDTRFIGYSRHEVNFKNAGANLL
jgi:hypothetical protein